MGRRPAERRPRAARRRRVVAVAALCAGLAVGGWSLARSSLFQLSRIDVVGLRILAPDAVIRASGLRVGQSMLGLDLDEVERRIVAGLPQVRWTSAGRDGATHVRIVVEERVPVLEARSPAGRWLLDRDGRVVGRARRSGALPVVRVAGRPDLPAGAAEAVRAIWRALPRAMAADVAWFEAPSLGDLRFRLKGTLVVFGRPERIREKLDALVLVARRVAAEGRRLLRVDVRAPGRPAARVA